MTKKFLYLKCDIESHISYLFYVFITQSLSESLQFLIFAEKFKLNESQQQELSLIRNECLKCCLQELGVASSPNRNAQQGDLANQMKMVGHELVRKQAICVMQNFLDDPESVDVINAGSVAESMGTESIVSALLASQFHDVHLPLLDWLHKNEALVAQNEALVKLLQDRLLGDEGCPDCVAGVRSSLSILYSVVN